MHLLLAKENQLKERVILDDEINLLNDYDFEPLDSDGDARPWLPEVSKGSLNVAVLWYRGAKVEKSDHFSLTPYRIIKDFEAANSIWRTTGGSMEIKFNAVYRKFVDYSPPKNTETLDEQDIEELIRDGRNSYSVADAYVFYIGGNSIPLRGPQVKATAGSRKVDNKVSHFIIMSDGAYGRIENGERVGNDYILAHEFGHIMYYTNNFGNKKDPKPNEGTTLPNGNPDYGHREDTPAERTNLMNPKMLPYGEIPIISQEQIRKALQSSYFFD